MIDLSNITFDLDALDEQRREFEVNLVAAARQMRWPPEPGSVSHQMAIEHLVEVAAKYGVTLDAEELATLPLRDVHKIALYQISAARLN